jgi:plasmid stabilization system protein ParE
VVSCRASEDLGRIFEYIALDSPGNADRMRLRLERAIDKLAFLPKRHPLAPERRKAGGELRHVLVRPFRIVYEVGAGTVHVHLVRHGAMLPADDL